jgi:hypothetical protein
MFAPLRQPSRPSVSQGSDLFVNLDELSEHGRYMIAELQVFSAELKHVTILNDLSAPGYRAKTELVIKLTSILGCDPGRLGQHRLSHRDGWSSDRGAEAGQAQLSADMIPTYDSVNRSVCR